MKGLSGNITTDICKLYRHGWTMDEIAQQLTIPKSRVERVLKYYNVKMRARGQRIDKIPLTHTMNRPNGHSAEVTKIHKHQVEAISLAKPDSEPHLVIMGKMHYNSLEASAKTIAKHLEHIQLMLTKIKVV